MSSIDVEVLDVGAGAPQVGVTISVTGVQHVVLDWSVDGGTTWQNVRGGDVSISSSDFVRDHFPPLERPVVYRATIAGSETVTSDPITVASDAWWLQDPLDPRRAVRVIVSGWPTEEATTLLVAGSIGTASLEQSNEALAIIGADLPVVSTGVRQKGGSLPAKFSHTAAVEGGKLLELFMKAGQLVVRTIGDTILDPVAHVVAGNVAHTRTSGGRTENFDTTIDQARPISAQIVVPYFTYDQVKATWSPLTYDEVEASRPGDTYVDWARDPEEGSP